MPLDQAFNLAVQHHQAGRLAAAEPIYRQILAERPNHPDALHHLGLIACQVGRNDLGIELIREAIALRPAWPDACYNLGKALHGNGQLNEAVEAYRRAISLRPDYPEAHCNLGVALKDQGRLDEAIATYRTALALKPNFPEAMINLGNAFNEQGKSEDAVAAFRDAIAISPHYPIAHSNLGNALRALGRFEEAIASCRQAIALQPDYPEAYSNLGNAIRDTGDLDNAIVAYRRALDLNPNLPEALNNLGTALRDKAIWNEASAAYRQAITLKPDYADAHSNLSLTLLLRGEFHEGWEEYEWRQRCDDSPPSRWSSSHPRWDGADLAGRTILLHAEQGFGDTIQFIRYAPLVATRAGRVIVECRPQLQRLLQSVPGIANFADPDQPKPPFDVHCPLLSLPRVFGTTLATIPGSVPYLHAERADIDRWRKRLVEYADTTVAEGNGVGARRETFSDTPTLGHPHTRRSAALSTGAQHAFNIGLAWAGSAKHVSDRNRSMPLSTLAPLADVRGVKFFSLQIGKAAAQAKQPPAGMTLIDGTGDLRDFADTAALIANLDLVICVDTAVAHLAGALGKPVWTLLPFVPDWRWLLDRDDSPWYPTMRLFRQRSIGDWPGVVERVVAALGEGRQ